MDKICSKCVVDPASHSFRKLLDKNGRCVFYTNPSKAKDHNDTEGILRHYDRALAQIGDKKWIWIFDGDGFESEHALEISTGRGIAALINEKYGNTLEEIKIINPTIHIKVILKLIRPFMSDLIESKIRMLDDRPYSVLEFI
jgi:CRAL/TRIO domain